MSAGRQPATTELSLPTESIAPALARAGVRSLTRDLPKPVAADLALMITEVVANAVQHAGMHATDDIVLRLSRDGAVRVEVVDRGPGFTPPRPPPRPEQRAAGGWGLFLVDHLADAWGVDQNDACTTVWFELDRPSVRG